MAQVLLEPTPSAMSTVLDSKDESRVDIEALPDTGDSESETSVNDVQPTFVDFDLNQTRLISSPYPDLANQLDLTTVDLQSRLFAFALSEMKPTRQDYATAPYHESFNWSAVFDTLRALSQQAGITWQKQEFYVVIFRSQLRPDADRARLGELDQRSHEEACGSGGLLKYWFGSTDAERRNLATCLWISREDAACGGRGPWHKKARGAAREMYDSISFDTHTLVVENEVCSWELRVSVG